MKIFNWIRNIFFVLAIIIIICIAACFALHLKPAVVMSGSMEPTFHTGSVVFVKQGAKVKVGDPIAFYVGDNYVTHRIIKESDGGYVTKGDGNDADDPWIVKDDMIEGKVMFSVPFVGYAFHFASSKVGIIVLGALLICLILSMFLVESSSGENETENEEVEALKAEIEEVKKMLADAKDELSEMRSQCAKTEKSYNGLLTRHMKILNALVQKKILTEEFVRKEKAVYKPIKGVDYEQ